MGNCINIGKRRTPSPDLPPGMAASESIHRWMARSDFSSMPSDEEDGGEAEDDVDGQSPALRRIKWRAAVETSLDGYLTASEYMNGEEESENCNRQQVAAAGQLQGNYCTFGDNSYSVSSSPSQAAAVAGRYSASSDYSDVEEVMPDTLIEPPIGGVREYASAEGRVEQKEAHERILTQDEEDQLELQPTQTNSDDSLDVMERTFSLQPVHHDQLPDVCHTPNKDNGDSNESSSSKDTEGEETHKKNDGNGSGRWIGNYDQRPIHALPTPFRNKAISPSRYERLVDENGRVRTEDNTISHYIHQKRLSLGPAPSLIPRPTATTIKPRPLSNNLEDMTNRTPI